MKSKRDYVRDWFAKAGSDLKIARPEAAGLADFAESFLVERFRREGLDPW